ncbi:MAG: 4-carboxymuconolactone decarboxylase [Hyphomicrobiales bacterium]|nr:4-carboxymuconolactone decarboxylase [Hyphomicrobiales bacterium]
MDDKTRFEQGTKVRRQVLGDVWVDKSENGTTEFNADWIDFISRTAWGDVWSRPGLDRRTRSVIVLTSTISTRNWEEFKLHVRASFNNGLTKEELAEIILQCAIYAGVPPANHAFKLAQEVFTEMGI